MLIKCKTWFFQKSQNLHFLNASFRARFDRCFIVIVTSETYTLSFLKFDRCLIVVSSFITPRDQSSSLVHRWENFWLFKLLLLMDASAYYVKHRCNTTKHPQDFFFNKQISLERLYSFFLKSVVLVLRKKCWLVQYVLLLPKLKNIFHTKSTCCLRVKRIVDKFNMFHFYPNTKIFSHTKSTYHWIAKGFCWSSSQFSHMLPLFPYFCLKAKKNASCFVAAANLNFKRKL